MWPRLNGPGRPYEGRAFTDVKCHQERLVQPLRMRNPKRIFVNSMSDMFHPEVSFEFVERVFEVMRSARQHEFIVLTKRPRRAYDYWQWRHDVHFAGYHQSVSPDNFHFYVSIEDQATADERIPILLDCPAEVHGISYEPALGPVVIPRIAELDHVIAGGESGPRARPSHPDWFRSVRDQCVAADVPFFFKQWGEWDWGEGTVAMKVSKRSAGRMLDGRTHDALPGGVLLNPLRPRS